MIRLIVSSICILTLIIGIGYLPANSPSKVLTAHADGGLVLLVAADEATETGGDEKGEKSEDQVPGIDRIASSVCYG
jgi:hypothetical protein